MPERRAPAFAGPHFATFAAGILLLLLVVRFWHPAYGFTAFFQLDSSNDNVKLAAFRELPVFVYQDTGGYDGLYYAQIALDPTLRDPALRDATDSLSYRARRILPPAAAWLAGSGDPARIVTAYSALNIVVWFALAALLWRVLQVNDWHGWLAWTGVMFSAGALCSIRLALTDLTAAAIVTATLAAAERGRKIGAAVGIALAPLARETAVLAVFGLLKRPWLSWKNAARLGIAIFPLVTWLAYIRWTLGNAEAGWGNFTWPLVGVAEKLASAFVAPFQMGDRILAWTTLATAISLIVQAAYIVSKRHPADRWWRTGAVYVLLLALLGTAVWEGFPGAASRVLLPLQIAFNVLAHRARAGFTWLLLGNMTILSGLLALKDVPFRGEELAAHGEGGRAVIVEAGPGWYGLEKSRKHEWLWARDHGELHIRCWPRSQTVVRLTFGLRALSPRQVRVLADGELQSEIAVQTQRREHTVELRILGGRGAIRFESTAPAVPENTSHEARLLGFAVYDVSAVVPNPQ